MIKVNYWDEFDWLIDDVRWSAPWSSWNGLWCSFLSGTECLGWCEYNNQSWMQIKPTRPRRPNFVQSVCGINTIHLLWNRATWSNTFMFMFRRRGPVVLSKSIILHQNYKFCWSTLIDVTYPGRHVIFTARKQVILNNEEAFCWQILVCLTFYLCEMKPSKGESPQTYRVIWTKWPIGMKRP